MKEHFQKLFAYNHWANGRFISCLLQSEVANAKNFLLMSHVLTAEEVWHCRLQHQPAPLERLWKEEELDNFLPKLEKLQEKWSLFLEKCEEKKLAENIRYTNSKGEAFTTAVADILTHVINHGTYHRAQIAVLLRQEAVDPPVTDYIAYVREQAASPGTAHA